MKKSFRTLEVIAGIAAGVLAVALSAFAVAGIPAAGQKYNEAMGEPSGGAPVTGGQRAASAAGAHTFTPARRPGITR